MKIVKRNIENVPLDVIGMLMNLLLRGGFEDCFNFFLAWAQTQRPPVIFFFLDGFPLSALYKFGNVGSASGKRCFERFFRIGERLGVHDAILYKRCHEILCGVGDMNGHLTVIEGLVRRGHFISMVASFSLHNIYKKESFVRSLHSLSAIVQHREFKDGIAPAVLNLGRISYSTGRPVIGGQPSVGGGCHIHLAKDKELPQFECAGGIDCFFCTVGMMLNVFSRRLANV